MISVIIPVYNAEAILKDFVQTVYNEVSSVTDRFEIVLVEDRSADESWQVLTKLSVEFEHLQCIRLSKNFGQHYAITCGLEQAKYEYVIVMDCDYQDDPAHIPTLIRTIKETNVDKVIVSRKSRQDSFLKKLSSILFYRILSLLTDYQYNHSVANYGIYNRKVIDSILESKDYYRYFPTLVQWVGYSSKIIELPHGSKSDLRKSSYTFRKLLKLSVDIILSNSDKPIYFIMYIGIALSCLGMLGAFWILFNALTGEYTVMGYASIMVTILFMSGLIFFMLGIIGLYIGRTFETTKQRPLYLIDEHLK